MVGADTISSFGAESGTLGSSGAHSTELSLFRETQGPEQSQRLTGPGVMFCAPALGSHM